MNNTTPDPKAILNMLGINNPVQVQPVHGGWDTAIWQVNDGSKLYALRVFRPEQAEICRKEVAVMRASATERIPVPAIYAREIWQDHPLLLMAWCHGKTLLAAMQAKPLDIWRYGLAFGITQARINRVTAPEEVRQQAANWIGKAGQAAAELRPLLQALDLRTDALLHLDYHPLNVMVDQMRVACVLDWANACAGDPRADYARTLTLLRMAPIPGDASQFARTRRLLEMGWRLGYRHIAGQLEDMPLFYAWAGAMMIADLAPRLGKPGSPLRPEHFEWMRAWVEYWKRRAGIAPKGAQP